MGGEAHSIGDHASMLPKNVIASQVNDVAARPMFRRGVALPPYTSRLREPPVKG